MRGVLTFIVICTPSSLQMIEYQLLRCSLDGMGAGATCRFVGNPGQQMLYLPPCVSVPPAAGPVETQFGTHLIYVESCNKPENTWKKLYDDIVDNVTGKGEEK